MSAVPAGFADTVAISGLNQPTDMAFAPDGRVFVSEKSGLIKVFDSLFVPLAKWSMLLTGNYRCITPHEPQSIRDAVHSDLKLSQSI